jgi:hypothetical protein
MDRNIQFQRLMIRRALDKDKRVLKFIDKPDPIVLSLRQRLTNFLLSLVGVRHGA